MFFVTVIPEICDSYMSKSIKHMEVYASENT